MVKIEIVKICLRYLSFTLKHTTTTLEYPKFFYYTQFPVPGFCALLATLETLVREIVRREHINFLATNLKVIFKRMLQAFGSLVCM